MTTEKMNSKAIKIMSFFLFFLLLKYNFIISYLSLYLVIVYIIYLSYYYRQFFRFTPLEYLMNKHSFT